jgi:hypothetical protein
MIVRKSKFAVRLQPSPMKDLCGGTETEDTTPNRFVNAAVPYFRVRAAELREKMKRASQEIAKNPAHMHQAEREGVARHVPMIGCLNFREKAQSHG